MLHKLRILKSDKKDKKERIKIINNAIKEGKKFKPDIEFVQVSDKNEKSITSIWRTIIKWWTRIFYNEYVQ